MIRTTEPAAKLDKPLMAASNSARLFVVLDNRPDASRENVTPAADRMYAQPPIRVSGSQEPSVYKVNRCPLPPAISLSTCSRKPPGRPRKLRSTVSSVADVEDACVDRFCHRCDK